MPLNLRRTTMWTLILLAVTMLAFALGTPSSFAVLVLAPATISCAIAALIYSRGVTGVGTVRVWLSIAIGVGCISLLAGAMMVLVRAPYEQLEQCLARAITPTAQRECRAEFDEAYEDLMENYGVVTKP